jgi:protein phosphatase
MGEQDTIPLYKKTLKSIGTFTSVIAKCTKKYEMGAFCLPIHISLENLNEKIYILGVGSYRILPEVIKIAMRKIFLNFSLPFNVLQDFKKIYEYTNKRLGIILIKDSFMQYIKSDENIAIYLYRKKIKEIVDKEKPIHLKPNTYIYLMSNKLEDPECLKSLSKKYVFPEIIAEKLVNSIYEDFSTSIIGWKTNFPYKKRIDSINSFSINSNKGLKRKNNEDAGLASSIVYDGIYENIKFKLLMVADGAGGLKAGEVASKEAIIESYSSLIDNLLLYNRKDNLNIVMNEAIMKANDNILALKEKIGTNMASTLTIALILSDNLYIAHVGDSRVYIITKYAKNYPYIEQLTEDHRLVQELVKQGKITLEQAKIHPQRNIITRALGVNKSLQVDTYGPIKLDEEQFILVCSDGLSDLVNDKEIAYIVTKNISPEKTINELIKLSNSRGGSDNITIALLAWKIK